MSEFSGETGSASGHLRAVESPGTRWTVLALVLVAEAMDLLDSLATAVAGPTMERHLGGGSALLQWVTAAYTIAMASGLLVGGRLGDVLGRSRTFQLGMAGFLIGSVGCALSPSWQLLLAARVLQGGFGALMLPQGLGLLKQVFPPEESGKAFGAFGPVMGLSTVGGPILAGWLVDQDLFGTSWRSIFLVNLLPAAVALLVGRRVLPSDQPDRRQRVDLASVVVATAAMGLLVFPLIQGRAFGWRWWIWMTLVAGVVALGGFVLLERSRARAGGGTLVSPDLLGQRSFLVGLGVGTAFFAALTASTFVFTVYLQLGLGFSTLRAALAAVPQAVGSVVGFGLAAGLLERLGNRSTMQVGQLLSAAGVASLAATIRWYDVAAHPLWMAPTLALLGTGMGMAMAPFFDSVLAGVDQADAGSASGVLNSVQQLAGALGIATVGTLFFHFLNSGAPRAGAVGACLATAALLVVAAALSAGLPRRAQPVVE